MNGFLDRIKNGDVQNVITQLLSHTISRLATGVEINYEAE
jgi:hypothetical protein